MTPIPSRPTNLPAGQWPEAALRVLRERYLLKDARGAVIETPEDLCWRVAWTVAQAERAWGADDRAVETQAQAFYRVMTHHEFLPNSPTLMNAGKGRGLTFAACFPPGTPITTPDGPRPIETLKPGDLVLTHRGHFRAIREVYTREVAEDLLHLKIRKLGPLTLTAEHPLLVVRATCWATHTIQPKWATAESLQPGDYVLAPIPEHSESLPEEVAIPLSEDACWLFGFYLANGSFMGHGVRFTVNRQDRPYAERICTIVAQTFGYSPRIEEVAPPSRPGTSWLDIRVHSTRTAELFNQLFRHGFSDKRLPNWVLSLPPSLQESLLTGVWQGDGTLISRGFYQQGRLVLSNETLIHQLFLLHLRLGHQPSLGALKPGRLATATPWSITLSGAHVAAFLERVFSGRRGQVPVHPRREAVEVLYSFQIPGYVLYRVDHISAEPYHGQVWNLEVEEDHSYTAHFIATHNCFVLPIEDSISGIFGTLTTAARIQQAGGGTGFSFSRLRPQGSRVRSSGGTSSGPVSFLRDAYNPMTDAVKQGSTRRGANMSVLRVDHPDILEFIDSKRDGGIRNFNISVGITDEFMEALKADGSYPLRAQPGWPRPDGTNYQDGAPYLDPETNQPMSLRAREVWDRICHAAWATGDPGLFFLDRTNRWRANPVPARYQVESTNPCVPGDTLVATPEGWTPAEKLAPGDWILTPAGPRRLARVERSVHPVFRVRFSDGGAVRATAGHQFFARLAAEPGAGTPPIRLDQLGRGDVVRVLRHGHPTLRDWSGEARILGSAPDGEAEVYDLYEPATDTWLPEGYLSRGCGEQPLYPNDQCTLGSVNLGAFVDPAAGTFDWDRLRAAVGLATRFLDNVLEASPTPTAEIGAMVRAIRRIGLGVMGWADALIRLGLPYDSEEAVALASQVMHFLTDTAAKASITLATARGPFPLWPESIWRDGPPRRNATVTTIAPTGTLSLLAGCSSGIEPLYAVAFTHTVRRPEGDRVLPIVNPLFETLMRERRLFSDALMAEVARRGTIRGLPEIPADLQRLFGTAHEIDLAWHVRHQAAFQAHTDNGVSKTINLPHSATVEDVDRAYRLAWELGCLGITVFRDGCKGDQVLTVGAATPDKAPAPALAAPTPAPDAPLVRPRPPRLDGPTFKIETPLGTAYVTVTFQDGEPLEVFVNIGKSGTDTGAFAEALGRLVSTLLRLQRLPSRPARAREVIDQLRQIGGSRDIGLGPHRIRSVPDAVAWALQQALQPAPDPWQLLLPEPPADANGPAPHHLGDLCPECGAAAVVYEEGCRHCLACGLYSEC